MTAMTETSLDTDPLRDSALYFNRELSQLDFNFRVLAQAQDPQVKMVEIKLSQGAKPGHGGVLPGPKVTEEIAETRGVPAGKDVISPPRHAEWESAEGMCEFIGLIKELTDKRLRRGVFTSVADLTEAITTWATHWNTDPKPFIWKATAEDIITKVQRGRATLHQIKTQTDH